jgi:multiple sugar transport system permease protein
MTSAATPAPQAAPARSTRRRASWQRVALYGFLTVMALVWLFPLVWALYTALRPFSDTQAKGYISFTTNLSIENFVNAWNQGDFAPHFLATLIVTIPAVIVTLIVASMVAFAVSRFSWKFNLTVLLIFTAGNLLPAQVIIVPLYKLYTGLKGVPPPLSDNGLLYDQYFGVFLINFVFQLGFCAFVLSNYMKTISHELTEAALVDGASVWRIWGGVVMPLCRPALAALATLEFTFIYNDFFWALLLMKTGDRRPITSALNNLQGQFFTNTNLLAAGALLAAVPTILVFLALQRHFISGLSLGATKG